MAGILLCPGDHTTAHCTLSAMCGMQVARNVQMEMHKHNNIGLSFIAGFGSYTEGELIVTTPCGMLEEVDISTGRGCPGVLFDGRWECLPHTVCEDASCLVCTGSHMGRSRGLAVQG